MAHYMREHMQHQVWEAWHAGLSMAEITRLLPTNKISVRTLISTQGGRVRVQLVEVASSAMTSEFGPTSLFAMSQSWSFVGLLLSDFGILGFQTGR